MHTSDRLITLKSDDIVGFCRALNSLYAERCCPASGTIVSIFITLVCWPIFIKISKSYAGVLNRKFEKSSKHTSVRKILIIWPEKLTLYNILTTSTKEADRARVDRVKEISQKSKCCLRRFSLWQQFFRKSADRELVLLRFIIYSRLLS